MVAVVTRLGRRDVAVQLLLALDRPVALETRPDVLHRRRRDEDVHAHEPLLLAGRCASHVHVEDRNLSARLHPVDCSARDPVAVVLYLCVLEEVVVGDVLIELLLRRVRGLRLSGGLGSARSGSLVRTSGARCSGLHMPRGSCVTWSTNQ